MPEPAIGDFPFTGELAAVGDAIVSWRDRVLDLAVEHPLETLITLVAGSAWLFYQAEKDENPGIETYDDAFYYISTCLSVGYANVYPVTQPGKFIAAMVMMLGPSVTAWVVEGRLQAREREKDLAPLEPATDLAAIGEKLDAILEELRAQRAGSAGP